jgi:hypothetical protein
MAARDRLVAPYRFHPTALVCGVAFVSFLCSMGGLAAEPPPEQRALRWVDLTPRDGAALAGAVKALETLCATDAQKAVTVVRIDTAQGHRIGVWCSAEQFRAAQQILESVPEAGAPAEMPVLRWIDGLGPKVGPALEAALKAAETLAATAGPRPVTVVRLDRPDGHQIAVWGTAVQCDLVREVLGRVPAAAPPDLPALRWLDLPLKDGTALAEAIKAAEALLNPGEAKTARIIRVETTDGVPQIGLWGTAQQQAVAQELLRRVPDVAVPTLVTKELEVRPGTTLERLRGRMVELDQQLRLRWYRIEQAAQQPATVLLCAPPLAAAQARAALLADELTFDDQALTSQHFRLYYDRAPKAVGEVLKAAQGKLGVDVSLTVEDPIAGTTTPGRPVISVFGPRSGVRDLRRVLATLDVPQPQVRLDIWAFQLSGGSAAAVRESAKQAEDSIATVGRLLRGYVAALEAATFSTRRATRGGTDQAPFSQERSKAPFSKLDRSEGQEWGKTAEGQDYELEEPADAEAPLSLTECLLLMYLGAAPNESAFDQQLTKWLEATAGSEPGLLRTWLSLLAETQPAPDSRAAAMVDLLDGVLRGRPVVVTPLRPRILRASMRGGTDEEAKAIRRTMVTYLSTHKVLAQDWRSVDPDEFARQGNRVQVALEAAERGLEQDIEELFLSPLKEALYRTAGGGQARRGRTGLGSASNTTIAVLSGSQTTVKATAVSYVDVTQTPKLTKETLTQAKDFGAELGALFPPATGSDKSMAKVYLDETKVTAETLAAWPGRLTGQFTALTVWPNDAETSLTLIGPRADVEGAIGLLKVEGIVKGEAPGVAPGSAGILPLASAAGMAPISALGLTAGGIPVDRLLALALALGEPDTVWEALTDGAELTVTPHVLPGAAAAELDFDFTVTHNADAQGAPKEPASKALPLSRVAVHQAKTRVYVNSLDLFGLSSFTLRVTTPKPDYVVPVLGQLPFLGRLFHFHRRPNSVHHDSVLLVYSTIVPTAPEAAGTFGLTAAPATEEAAVQ